MFAAENILKQLCEKIIIPNLRLSQADIELFDFNGIEYVRRDSEGSDSNTRRRGAADLVKQLTIKFPQPVTNLFSGYVYALLQDYQKDPINNILAKDCAIYMVMALTILQKTVADGATTTNNFVNINEFYKEQIEPELKNEKINETPLLKADALKFITIFRRQFSKEIQLEIIPYVLNLLKAQSFVVHSYAAVLLYRLLILKDESPLHPNKYSNI